MPIRSTSFYENGYYHVYNRGVEKRKIFLDDRDYESFTGILRTYLSDPSERVRLLLRASLQGRALERISRHNLHNEVNLIAYCLMPNHFHILVQQKSADSITRLMRRVLTAYSMYFNEKNDRVGSLFQGRFKAKEIVKDDYLLHLTRYIHRNPLESSLVNLGELNSYRWSSYQTYLGITERSWVKPSFVLDYFSKNKRDDYKHFVEHETEEILPKEFMIDGN